MAELEKSAATLRFSGDDLDPDALSAALSAKPDKSVRKGEIWRTPKGDPVVARTGMWHLTTARRQPGDLDRHVADLLIAMTADLTVWNDIASRYDGQIFAGLFMATPNEGAIVSAQTLLALGSRGLSLQLDIYHMNDDESSASESG